MPLSTAVLKLRFVSAAALCVVLDVGLISAARAPRRPLTSGDIDDIARLLMLEDTRHLDETALIHILRSAHPEVRRRATVAIGRIRDPRGSALLTAVRDDPDVEVAAAVAFAAGQLKDTAAVGWLAERLASPRTPSAIAAEAARSLGKIRSPEARSALARYLSEAPAAAAAGPVVGEALLAIGRFTGRDDLAPILRWATSSNVEVRWRAAWALYRPRDPAAVPHLLRLSEDRSGEVRFWGMRGLTPSPAGRGGDPPLAQPVVDPARLAARLREALRDPDRRVRTEALRALAQYDDDASFAEVLKALDSQDSWLSISAAEALGRFQRHAEVAVPKLLAATAAGRPVALRIAALAPLTTLAPARALEPADALVRDPSLVARSAAVQAFRQLGDAGRSRLEALAADPATKGLVPVPGTRRPAAAPPPARPDAEYRSIVERWIVPDYNGGRKPRAVWDTPRGSIELELYAGDAPLGVEHFIRVVESGEIVGTEFGRVVPNFVAQQRAIRDDLTLRDEVSRRGLTRGNLSWASAGLDTGRPGYTLAVTPQPHNEGDFTALGRVIRGMEVVERLELGDRITGARIER